MRWWRVKPLGSRDDRSRLGSARALAVVLAVAGLLAGCSVAGASPSPSPTISSPSASASPSLEVPAPTPASSSATAAPSAATFSLPGVASNWTGLSWSKLASDNPLVSADSGARLISWSHGYVVYGTSNGGSNGFVLTSPDGATWNQVTAIGTDYVLVAASSTELVAMTETATTAATVWTSTDGVQWRNAGTPSGLSVVDSIAGTAAGFVATDHSVSGSGKTATGTFGVAYSSDGITWTPVDVGTAISWDEVGPQVQSGANRFFVTGGYTGGQASQAAYRLDALHEPAGTDRGIVASGAASTPGLWWSDDGRTWTAATGLTSYGATLLVGRSGMLLGTTDREVPGAIGLETSSDGGKSWRDDTGFAPVGAVVCGQGECTPGPDGSFAANGAVLLAMKNNGQAWVSYDAKTWTAVTWTGSSAGGSFMVLPRGVLVGVNYGAAK